MQVETAWFQPLNLKCDLLVSKICFQFQLVVRYAEANPTIEDVGTIEGLLDAIGPAITGSIAVEPEEVTAMETLTLVGPCTS